MMNLLKSNLFLRKNIFFLLLILIAILPRFIFLSNVPNAINQDELHYALDAKSFFLTGKDVLGQTSLVDVLLFNSPKSEPLQAELQYFFEIPVLGLMGFSMTNLVLPNVLLGILTVVLIYLITLKLFDKNTALLAGLIAAINPWLIFLSRTTYEAGPATLFFLCVFYMMLITKSWKILLTIPFALLAFYSHIATKLIFLPFMSLSILYAFLSVNKRKYFKQYLFLFMFSCVLTLFFLFQLKQGKSSRGTEILLPNSIAIIQRVNEVRKATIQNPFINLVENKFTVYGSFLVRNTFNIFSPTYLFANADYFFMLGGHGLFYYIDSFFLIIGLGWAFLKNKKLFLTFVLIIFVGIVPQIVHSSSVNGNFSHHIALSIPFMIIFMSLGINGVFGKFKDKKRRVLFIVLIALIYIFSFLRFSNFYFFRYPLQAGTFGVENRILSKYITLSEDEKRPIIIYSVNPMLAFKEFLFYSNLYNKNTVKTINESLKDKKFIYNNISFISCSRSMLPDSQPVLVIDDANCDRSRSEHSISIAQLEDSGKKYNIYGDKACSSFNLPGYISNLKLSDFDVENLPAKKFCETFIVSY